MISSFRNLSYKERLKRLGLFTFRCKKLMGDIIEMFKMIYGIDKVNLGRFFVKMRIEE